MSNEITFAEWFKMVSKNRHGPSYALLPEFVDAAVGGQAVDLPNLLDDASFETIRQKASGKRSLTKVEAQVLLDNLAFDQLETYLNDSIPNSRLPQIRNELAERGFILPDTWDESEIPLACAKLLKKILFDLSRGRKSTLPPLEYTDLKNLGEVVSRGAYYKDGSLFVHGEKIRAASTIERIPIKDVGDLRFAQKLFEVYAEQIQREVRGIEGLSNTPFNKHFSEHARFYFDARCKEKAAGELFENGEREFEALKQEISDGIYDALCFANHKDGLERLTCVMREACCLSINGSLLLSIRGFIDVPTKKGILHVLVDEGKIQSWVNPND